MTTAPPAASARQADRVAALFLLAFASFVIVEARALPYWTANAPGPGFLPFWLGVLLACGALVLLVRSVGRAEALPHKTPAEALPHKTPAEALPHLGGSSTRRLVVIVAMTAGAALLALVIGLVLASGVFMGASLAYLRPEHRRANAIATLLTPLVVWLLFVRWLGVPLPTGPFGW